MNAAGWQVSDSAAPPGGGWSVSDSPTPVASAPATPKAASPAVPPTPRPPAPPVSTSIAAPQFLPGDQYKPPPPTAMPPSLRLATPAGANFETPQAAADYETTPTEVAAQRAAPIASQAAATAAPAPNAGAAAAGLGTTATQPTPAVPQPSAPADGAQQSQQDALRTEGQREGWMPHKTGGSAPAGNPVYHPGENAPNIAEQPLAPPILKGASTVFRALWPMGTNDWDRRIAEGQRAAADFDARHPSLAASRKGITDTLTGLTTPANLALLAVLPESKPIQAFFAGQAGVGAYDNADHAYQAWRAGKNPEAAQYLTESGLDAVFAALAGTSAVRGGHGAVPRETPEEKPVLHGTDNVDTLREHAPAAAEKLGDAAKAATEQVPGTELEAVRDVKSTGSVENKLDRGYKPSQIGDIAAAKVTVPDQAAADQVLAGVNRELPVVSKEGEVAGEPGKNGVRQTQAIVRTGQPGEPVQHAELLLQTPEMSKAADGTHDDYRRAQDLRAQGDEAGAAKIEAEIQQKHEAAEDAARQRIAGGQTQAQPEPRYKYGNTQAPIRDDAPAAQALNEARAKIPDADLAGDGRDVGADGNHVTVRYGIDSDDTKGIEDYLRSQPPFTAHLGETEVFPPTKNSNGAAVLVARIESPELTRMNGEIEREGKFAPSDFPDYKPHATIAYIDPAKAEQYQGKLDLKGKDFPIDHISIADRNGNQREIPLEGKTSDALRPSEIISPGQTAYESALEEYDRLAEEAGQMYGDPEVTQNERDQLSVRMDRLKQVIEQAEHAGWKPRGEGARAEPPRVERRANDTRRYQVDQMSPDEMRRALLTNEVSGLPNRRAFDEAQNTKPAAAIAMSDADGLKALNDKFGYAAGDAMLRAKAEALKKAGLEAYHEKGDEFLYRGDNEADLQQRLEQARKILAQSPIDVKMKDGTTTTFKGADFSYGTGPETAKAEDALKQHKAEREQRGERARGELRGITESRPVESRVDQVPPTGERQQAERRAPRPPDRVAGRDELQPGEAGRMKLSDLKLAPKRFQYKLGTNESGITNLLSGRRWSEDLAGRIETWRDPADGQVFVVNGHHRFGLAKESGQPSIGVDMMRTSTAEQARAVGALRNIAHGRGSAIDAAKFFRDSDFTVEDLDKLGVSMGEATAANGMALSRLDPKLFDDAVSGKLSQGRAIAIGKASEDAADQDAILKLIDRAEKKGKRVSDDVVEELGRMVAGAGKHTETQQNLFGLQEMTKNLALEKADISQAVRDRLGEEKRTFAAVGKDARAEKLSQVEGQTVKAQANRDIAQKAGQDLELYDRLSTRGGTIDSILNHAAKELADGGNANQIKQRAYDGIRRELSQALPAAEAGSDRGVRAPQQEEQAAPGERRAPRPPSRTREPAAGSAADRVDRNEPDGREPAGKPSVEEPAFKQGRQSTPVMVRDDAGNWQQGTLEFFNPGYNGAKSVGQVTLANGFKMKNVRPSEMRLATEEASAGETAGKGDHWIGVDLDGTLAHYDGFKGASVVGRPVPEMVDRVKQWLKDGKDVRIFTARIADDPDGAARKAIEEWSETHLGRKLPVTNVKDAHMTAIYDDRAVQVERNSGKINPNDEAQASAVEEDKAKPKAGGVPRGTQPREAGRPAVGDGAAREAGSEGARSAGASSEQTRIERFNLGRDEAKGRVLHENAAQAKPEIHPLPGDTGKATVLDPDSAVLWHRVFSQFRSPDGRNPLGVGVNWRGMTLDRKVASLASFALRDRALKAKTGFAANPEAAAGLERLAKALDDAREGRGAAVVLRGDYRDDTAREEAIHLWDRSHGLTRSEASQRLAQQPEFESTFHRLKDMGYGKADSEEGRQEIAAEMMGKALAGDPDLKATPEQRTAIVSSYLDAAIEEYGPEILKDLPPVDPDMQETVRELSRRHDYGEQYDQRAEGRQGEGLREPGGRGGEGPGQEGGAGGSPERAREPGTRGQPTAADLQRGTPEERPKEDQLGPSFQRGKAPKPPQSLALPGMEAADRERADAAAQAEGERLSETLRTPKGSISRAAGKMERESPLFSGTGENPTLFQREPARVIDISTARRTGAKADDQPRLDGLFAKAIELEDAGDPEAEATYKKILDADPDHTEALVNLGSILYRKGMSDAAADLYKRATKADQDYVLAWYNLGTALDESGRVRQAADAFEHALKLDPQYADAHYNAAVALERLGEPEKALPHWQKYVSLDRTGPWSERAKDQIAKTVDRTGLKAMPPDTRPNLQHTLFQKPDEGGDWTPYEPTEPKDDEHEESAAPAKAVSADVNRPLKDLKDSIDNRLAAKPKEPAIERMTGWIGRAAEKTISDTGEFAKGAGDTFQNALAWTKSVSSALWRDFTHPYEQSDWKDGQKQLTLSENTSSQQIMHTMRQLVKAVPDEKTRVAMSIWSEAQAHHGPAETPDGLLRKWASQAETSGRHKPAEYKAALNLTDDQKAVAGDIRKTFDQYLDMAKQTGMLEKGLRGYVTHMLDRQSAQAALRALDTESLNPNPSFLLHRFYPTMFEAENAGLKFRTKDIGQVLAAYSNGFNKAMASRDWIKSMFFARANEGANLAPLEREVALARTAKETAQSAVDKAAADTRLKAASEALTQARAGAGDPIFAFQPRGGDWRQLKEAELPQLMSQNPQKPRNMADYVKLDFPALRNFVFRPTAEDLAPYVAQGKLFDDPEKVAVPGDILVQKKFVPAVRNMLELPWLERESPNWRVEAAKTAVRGLMKASSIVKEVNVFGAPFHLATEGARAATRGVNPFHIKPIDLSSPIDQMGAQNMKLYNFDQEGLFGAHALHGVLKGVPGLNTAVDLVNKQSNWLFNDYIPAMKMEAFRKGFQANKKMYSDLSEPEAAELTGRQVDAAFGNINHALDSIPRNKSVQQAMRLAFFAPDFLEGELRTYAQSFSRYGGFQRRALLRGTLSLYLAARAVNALANKGDAKWAPEDALSLVINGKRVSLKTEVTDLVNLAADPRMFASSRLNPLTSRTAVNLLTGRDEYGRQQTLGQQTEDLAKRATPFGIQKVINTPDESLADSLLTSFGIHVSNYRSPFENQVHQKYLEGLPPGTQDSETAAESRNRRQLEDKVRAGTMTPREVWKLRDEGGLTTADAGEITERARQSRLEIEFKGLKDEDAWKMYQKAPDDAKFELHDAMARKVAGLYKGLADEQRSEKLASVEEALKPYNPHQHSAENYQENPKGPLHMAEK